MVGWLLNKNGFSKNERYLEKEEEEEKTALLFIVLNQFLQIKMARLTFLPLSHWTSTACREPAWYFLKVDVIVPILIKGMKQPCKMGENVRAQINWENNWIAQVSLLKTYWSICKWKSHLLKPSLLSEHEISRNRERFNEQESKGEVSVSGCKSDARRVWVTFQYRQLNTSIYKYYITFT